MLFGFGRRDDASEGEAPAGGCCPAPDKRESASIPGLSPERPQTVSRTSPERALDSPWAIPPTVPRLSPDCSQTIPRPSPDHPSGPRGPSPNCLQIIPRPSPRLSPGCPQVVPGPFPDCPQHIPDCPQTVPRPSPDRPQIISIPSPRLSPGRPQDVPRLLYRLRVSRLQGSHTVQDPEHSANYWLHMLSERQAGSCCPGGLGTATKAP